MNKYHNGKIYEIVDVGYNKCYIGSTTESLSRRFSKHKHPYKKHTTKTITGDIVGVLICLMNTDLIIVKLN